MLPRHRLRYSARRRKRRARRPGLGGRRRQLPVGALRGPARPARRPHAGDLGRALHILDRVRSPLVDRGRVSPRGWGAGRRRGRRYRGWRRGVECRSARQGSGRHGLQSGGGERGCGARGGAPVRPSCGDAPRVSSGAPRGRGRRPPDRPVLPPPRGPAGCRDHALHWTPDPWKLLPLQGHNPGAGLGARACAGPRVPVAAEGE
mmetsp:Transcript_72632/g.228815  ORF Transcript_72632/g.228815 Transcript_72632/m.228815 type:complete len:204 (+) Transcript_72632:577-1188(+)